MKSSNKKFKKVLTMILVISMCIGCGKNDKVSNTNNINSKNTIKSNSANDKSSNNNENSSNSEEFVYQASYTPIEEKFSSISDAIYKNDKIYLSGIKLEKTKKKDKDENIIYKSTNMIYSMSEDGTDTQNILLDLKDDEYVYTFNIDSDNNIIALVQKSTELKSNDNSDDDKYEQKYIIKKFDTNGKELSSVELDVSDVANKEGYLYISDAIITDDKLYICSEEFVLIYDMKGKQILKLKDNNDYNYINSIILDKNNKLYYCGYNENYDNVLKEVDINKEEVVNEYKLPESYKYDFVLTDETYDFYIKSDDGLYGYILETQEAIKILDWLSADINSDEISLLDVVDDNIICNTRNYDDTEEKEIIKISKVLQSDVKEKQVLTLAISYSSTEVRKAIIDFNKKNDDYRIELIDYTQYDDPSTQLNSDMISGNIPDIVDTSLGLEKFTSKGLLTDLNPFIENDPDISKDDFVDEVINAMEQNGKLYYMTTYFGMRTLLGHKDDINGRKSWTIKDAEQLIDSKPDDVQFLPNVSNTAFIYYICSTSLGQYINWETGECNFESQDFLDILEFCNKFPNEEEIDYSNYSESSMMQDIRNRKVLLTTTYISDLGSYKFWESMFGEDCEVIGYPTNEGTGIICTFDGPNYAITQKCENKEIAWEFIKNQLTYEYQKKNVNYGLSIRKDALEKQFEKAMATKEYVDEDGDTIYPYSMSYSVDDFLVNIKPFKQKEIDKIKEIISRIDMANSDTDTSYDIINIIQEEAQTYFNGQKSVQEAASIIQSRIKIYINENM